MSNFDDIMSMYPFLDTLDDEAKSIVKSSLIIKRFDTDYTLMQEGASCLGFSLIANGSIRVYKISNKGREVTLYKLSSGDTCYLSMSCMLSNKSYPAYAQVIEPATVVFIPSNVFSKYIYNTLEFQKYLFTNLYTKFNDVINVLEEVAFESIDTRVAKYLLSISKNSNNSKFLYLTQEKIAQEVGTSREVVSRMITDFKNKEILTSQRGKITILNFEKLNSIAKL